MRVLVFGDSIAYGAWDTQGGWVDRLKNHYNGFKIDKTQRNPATVMNLGNGGDISDDVIKRIDSEIALRKWPGEDFIIVIAIGINDSFVFKGNGKSSPNKFAGNLNLIDELIKKHTNNAVYVGLTPVDDDLVGSKVTDDVQYFNDRIANFNNTIEQFCQSESRPYVNIREPFLAKSNWKNMLFDGLHPNDEGHELIYNTVKPHIDKLLEA